MTNATHAKPNKASTIARRTSRHARQLFRDALPFTAGLLAGAVLTLAMTGHAGTGQPAGARVACAQTEDSYLTDCHGDRLDYRHGAWFAPQSGTVQSFNDGFATSKQDDCQQGFRQACQWQSAALSAARHARQLPRWVHWQYASRQARREVCGTWHHGRVVPGIWAAGGNGDTSVMICANGKAETS